MSRRQAGRRVSSGRGRTGRQANLTGESASDKPDASRQRRSTPGGINAATTDSSACIKQPTPEFNTADTNYQGLKTGPKLRQPDDGSSNTPTKTKAHDKREEDSDLEPDPCRPTQPSPQPRHSSPRRPGNVTRTHQASAGSTGQLLLRTTRS